MVEAPIRKFSQVSRAWYADELFNCMEDNIVDIVTIGLYYADDSTTGEFSMYWTALKNEITIHLLAYNDSWKVLSTMTELLEYLVDIDTTNISPNEFATKLVQLGFLDKTAVVPQ